MSASRVFKRSLEKSKLLRRDKKSVSNNHQSNAQVNESPSSSEGVEENRKHWEKMREIAEGEDDTNRISRAAMESIGVPYKKLLLHRKVEEFYILDEEDWDGRKTRKRVHLNSIPERLLRVLFRTTPIMDKHHFLYLMEQWRIIGGDRDYPIYDQGDRAAMCQIDVDGNLMEMPSTLEKALKQDKEYFDKVLSQKAIKAFYAPPRLRQILYHTAPPEERCYYLLNEEERKAALEIDYPETNWMLRFRLIERLDENGQIRELSDELERAIIDEEIVDEYDLANFDRA